MSMFDVTNVQPSRIILPPRITIYGPEKVGKTTFAASIPDAVIADLEAGSGAQTARRFMRNPETGMLTTYKSFLDLVDSVERQEHQLSAFVVDSVDWLETLVFEQVAAEYGKRTVADIDYGKGHAAAENIFHDLFRRLDRLRDRRGMAVVLIAHSEVVRFDNPISASYDQYRLKLHKRIAPLVNEWSDCLLFANTAVKVSKEQVGMVKVNKASDQGMVLYTGKSEAYVAGNRYGLPPVIPFTWGDFIEAFNQATADGPASAAAA